MVTAYYREEIYIASKSEQVFSLFYVAKNPKKCRGVLLHCAEKSTPDLIIQDAIQRLLFATFLFSS
jgi:hypothetical protein